MANLYDKASLVLPTSPAYKDGAIQAYKPLTSQGTFDFSRGSNLAATRVNADGLIEKGRENLLLNSNQFNSTWYPSSQMLTPIGGQSGYDGSNDAWKIQRSDVNGRFLRQYISQSGVQTFSVYAKKGNVDYIALVTVGGQTTNAIFSLPTDGSGTNTFLDSDNISAEITYISNGWYRVSTTFNEPITDVRIYPSETATAQNGVITDAFIYIQDAQLEQGLVATDYIETGASTAQAGILEDMPRLDYSGGATCPALLLEPQRTNVVPQSEYFDDNSNWFKYNLGAGSLPIVTDNYGESPEGLQNAARLQLDAGGISSTDRSRLYTTIATTNGTNYTWSFYAKSNTGNNEYIKPRAADVNYSEITITTEWQRFDVSFTANATGTFQYGFECRGNHTENSVDILIYGAQLEQGSYPTSYIPTYGSSVTRNDEELNVLGQSSNIGQTSGTIFLESSALSDDNTNRVVSLSDGTSSNRVLLLYQATSNTIRGQFSVSGQSSLVIDGTFDTTQNRKIAFAYDDTSVVLYVDGSEVGTTSTGYTFGATLDDVRFDNIGGGNFIGNVKQFSLFPTRLTNAELADLTTL